MLTAESTGTDIPFLPCCTVLRYHYSSSLGIRIMISAVCTRVKTSPDYLYEENGELLVV